MGGEMERQQGPYHVLFPIPFPFPFPFPSPSLSFPSFNFDLAFQQKSNQNNTKYKAHFEEPHQVEGVRAQQLLQPLLQQQKEFAIVEASWEAAGPQAQEHALE